MLVHCFLLLEFKFAFEFNCLIFSLNLSKFRSLFLPLEIPARSRVAPSASRPSPASRQPSKVRWSTLFFSAQCSFTPWPSRFGPPAAQQQPSSAAPSPSAAVADTRDPPVIPYLRRLRAGLELESELAAPRTASARQGRPALFKEPPPPVDPHAFKP